MRDVGRRKRCGIWINYPVEGAGRGAPEHGAHVGSEIVDADVLVLHVPPRPDVGEAAGTDAGDELGASGLDGKSRGCAGRS